MGAVDLGHRLRFPVDCGPACKLEQVAVLNFYEKTQSRVACEVAIRVEVVIAGLVRELKTHLAGNPHETVIATAVGGVHAERSALHFSTVSAEAIHSR